MGKTLDLGRRIEIHSMDRHCEDISIGLYRQIVEGQPQFQVHTYCKTDAAAERIAFLRQALIIMLGLVDVDDESTWLRFPCGSEHLRALKRGFLDLCKLETGDRLEAKPLEAFDKRADSQLQASGLGEGKYEMRAVSDDHQSWKRAAALSRGFAKLCEMHELEEPANTVQFPCQHDHDEMIGMLMYRAQNVRAALREDQLSAGRGVLAPPSQQSET